MKVHFHKCCPNSVCTRDEGTKCRLEAETQTRWRFVVGRILESESQAVLEKEQIAHQDFHVLDVPETYDNLVLKVYLCRYANLYQGDKLHMASTCRFIPFCKMCKPSTILHTLSRLMMTYTSGTQHVMSRVLCDFRVAWQMVAQLDRVMYLWEVSKCRELHTRHASYDSTRS